MGSLPRGSVTFLFTDIEGSTRLVRELGDGYARVLDDHRRLLERAAVDGVLFGTAGDACFFAFGDPAAAVEAAIRAQRGLAGSPVRVRMGIHTGTPLIVGGDYVGLDVHRAARVCDAANGGHVLLTEAAARAAGADTVDLGEHRLKDLPELQRLHQLALPGLARDSAPLRLPAARLAPAGEALLGRERELAALRALLERERLVTLVGPAGVGKTRLALAVAAVETGRVEVVELATVNDPDAVPAAVGDAELAGALLVLDNFEQLLDGAAHVAELLRRHEGLRVLVTSRAPLRVGGEHVVPVEPLDDAAALALFRARAAAAGAPPTVPDDERAVAEICARLDGLPLAIELAAARARVLRPAALLRRLDERFDLLATRNRDVPARQRTLRSALDWSFGLLGPSEREAFVRLGVFAGPFSLDAAAAVTGADLDLLETFVDHSLLRADGSAAEPRFSLLETVRAYARERLVQRGELAEFERRHLRWCVELARRAEPLLIGPDQVEWLDALAGEHANLRAALAQALEDDVVAGLEIAGRLWRYWETRGHAVEARRWLEQALPAAPPRPLEASAKAHLALGRLLLVDGEYDGAARHFESARLQAEAIGDDVGRAFAQAQLGWIAIVRGEYERAERICAEALETARATGDDWITFGVLGNYAGAVIELGDIPRARALLEESLAAVRRVGDLRNVSNALCNLGWAALVDGDPEAALPLLEESLHVATELGDVIQLPSVFHLLGMQANDVGDHTRAEEVLREGLATGKGLGERHQVAETLAELARALVARAPDEAAEALAAAEALYAELGVQPPPRDQERTERTRAAIAAAQVTRAG